MMKTGGRSVYGAGSARQLILPQALVQAAVGKHPLLRGFLVVGAGYAPRLDGSLLRSAQGPRDATLIYCVKGKGWAELAGRRHTVRAGDLLVLPPETPWSCGAHASNPWTVHWAQATGANLRAYLEALETTPEKPVLGFGEDPQRIRLFHEILQALERGFGFVNLLQASHALAYLLAALIRSRREGHHEPADRMQKVAQAIIYMSEHADQPLRVTALARLASLSTAHFSVLFKQATGCSPREYLHLLRIHRACQLLQNTSLSVKEIAARLGYLDPFHFSRQFKAFEGRSPSEYRASKISSA